MAVDVFLWGHHVGRIAPDFGSYCQFQYDPDFIRTGIQIAPIKMPLREQIYKAAEQLFRRMAFNVYSMEMDDHTKNFSFMMREGGAWELAPAYDLTGCRFSADDPAWNDWQNLHALSVNGKFSRITDEDLLRVGERYGLGTAQRVLEQVKAATAC